jgi:hypothetical protein
MKRSAIHWVTITETGDEEEPRLYEVEHPLGCRVDLDAEPLPSMFGPWFGSRWWFGGAPGQMHASWTCWPQMDIDAIGPDEYFDDFPAGRSAFRSWGDYDSWTREYDGGVELVEEERCSRS